MVLTLIFVWCLGEAERRKTHSSSTMAFNQGCTFNSSKEPLKILMLRSYSRQIYQNLWETLASVFLGSPRWCQCTGVFENHCFSLSITSLSYLNKELSQIPMGGKRQGAETQGKEIRSLFLSKSSTQGRTWDRWDLLPSGTSHTSMPSTRHRAKNVNYVTPFPKPTSF